MDAKDWCLFVPSSKTLSSWLKVVGPYDWNKTLEDAVETVEKMTEGWTEEKKEGGISMDEFEIQGNLIYLQTKGNRAGLSIS